ncbi:acyltransferase family protein [Oceanicola sp. S124]|uniref:acyltransferase family protein n=1 Tax=Oceanicola sp. S124 TaxID=1042378 RepID=UPI0002559C87|nr:acyltransferase family protein [Oceanicola sp. S124]
MSGSTHSRGGYRRDIDGLRAVAVVSVFLAHAKIALFSGGFVGVDVFFVISGYLITGILLREVEEGRFSIFAFYERRVRRIFPALYAMALVVSVACWLLFLPVDFKEFGESLAAVALFLSNFYFDMKSGYFDTSSEFRPLLHTWSLGVEEQFYIVFPLLLVLMARLRLIRHALPVFVLLWLLSFAGAVQGVATDMQSAFYMPWLRAWELLSGSLIALSLRGGATALAAPLRQALSVLGLGLILLPVLLYSEDTPFPGLAALFPVLGAALLIKLGEGGEETLAAGLLGLRPVVYVGRISYSLYLWHWPPLVFMRYLSEGEPALWLEITAVAGAIGMAVLSYHFIEQPFRRKGFLTQRSVLVGGVAICCLAFLFGASGRVYDGIPSRLPDRVAELSNVALDINPRRRACNGLSPERIRGGDYCVEGAEGVPPDFAIIGDSFGDAMAPGITAAGAAAGRAGYVLTYGGCYPLLGVTQGERVCADFFAAAAEQIASREEVRDVFLVARWSSAFEASRFGLNRGSIFLTDADHSDPSVETNRIVAEAGLRRMLDSLQDKRIHVVAYVPEQETNIPRATGVNALMHRERDFGVSRAQFEQRQAYTRVVLDRLAAEYPRLSVVDVGEQLCGPDICPATRDGGLSLYVDDNHLSRTTVMSMLPFWQGSLFEGGAAAPRG